MYIKPSMYMPMYVPSLNKDFIIIIIIIIIIRSIQNQNSFNPMIPAPRNAQSATEKQGTDLELQVLKRVHIVNYGLSSKSRH